MWSVRCLLDRGASWSSRTGPGMPALALPGPPPPLTLHAPLSMPWVLINLFPFPPGPPWSDFHPTKPNTLLLTYLLKSCEAFQTADMTSFFTWPHGSSKSGRHFVPPTKWRPHSGCCIWVAATHLGDKLLHFATLPSSAVLQKLSAKFKCLCSTVLQTSLRQQKEEISLVAAILSCP